MKTLTYRDAVNAALHEEMELDPSVFVYGIDVGDHKRIFGTTNNLVEDFGPDRCFSTPLCEETLVGFGLGAAITGQRPVNVHMRVDFLLLAMNQLANMVTTWSYGSGGSLRVPFVIRAIIGRGWGQSYQHCKSLQSIFGHIPGLRVVMPATPADAKGMLKAAIRCDDPVLVIEHRWLYDAEGVVGDLDEIAPLEGASILRPGTDLTIAATSWMNVEAMHAAKILGKAGVGCEIVDVRAVAPLDDTTVAASVAKTGYCVVADTDWVPYGLGAELAARLHERCFDSLKAPVKRVGFAFTHCPCSRPLENLFYPNAGQIVRAAEELLKLPPVDLEGEDFYSYERKFRGPF